VLPHHAILQVSKQDFNFFPRPLLAFVLLCILLCPLLGGLVQNLDLGEFLCVPPAVFQFGHELSLSLLKLAFHFL